MRNNAAEEDRDACHQSPPLAQHDSPGMSADDVSTQQKLLRLRKKNSL